MTSDPSPPPSTESLKPCKTSPAGRLNNLLNKVNQTAGLLTPTETLELAELADYYRSKYLDSQEEIADLEWYLSHPTNKDQ